MVTYKCGGYASYTGHCGASDCETCYPGCSEQEHTLYTKTFTIEVFSKESLEGLNIQDIAKLEFEEDAYIHMKNLNSEKQEEWTGESATRHLQDKSDELQLGFDLDYILEE